MSIASYIFCGWVDYRFVLILFGSTIVNYSFGKLVTHGFKNRTLYLWISLLLNVGVWVIFRYNNVFGITIHNDIAVNKLLSDIVLPVGFSFYMLMHMSYVWDVYRGKEKASSLVDYALYAGFFPLQLAGPVERAGHMLPQIRRKRFFAYAQAVAGGRLIIWGMFKKVVIADSIAGIIDVIFNAPGSYGAFSLIVAAIGFSFWLYGSFSGYADIALGIAKLFGFDISVNFYYPFFAKDPITFWQRWFRTFSYWLKDYVYLPLGGSKRGVTCTSINIALVFMAGGLWYGANLSIMTGALIEAFGVVVFMLLQLRWGNVFSTGVMRYLSGLITFSWITFGWIFLRYSDLSASLKYIKRIITNSIDFPAQYLSLPYGATILNYIIPLILAEWWMSRSGQVVRMPRNKLIRYIMYYILVVACYFLFDQNDNYFVYTVFKIPGSL
ncbi:MAG: MBOAT family protein [Chitinophagaceae bacterium]|nr:MBOAT family protein [Chitinophagaceae bacterium]